MKSVALGIKLTDEEEALLAEVQKEHPMIKRAAVGEVLILLGIIEYWRSHSHGGTLDLHKFLGDAQNAMKQAKATPKKK